MVDGFEGVKWSWRTVDTWHPVVGLEFLKGHWYEYIFKFHRDPRIERTMDRS